MLFKMLLWLMGLRIAWLAKNDADFKKAIAKKRCVLQFQTEDHTVTRYYSFAGGKTHSENQKHKSPSLIFAFEDASVVPRLILSMARDPNDRGVFMAAMNKGKIRIQGDISLLTWFMSIAEMLGPRTK